MRWKQLTFRMSHVRCPNQARAEGGGRSVPAAHHSNGLFVVNGERGFQNTQCPRTQAHKSRNPAALSPHFLDLIDTLVACATIYIYRFTSSRRIISIAAAAAPS